MARTLTAGPIVDTVLACDVATEGLSGTYPSSVTYPGSDVYPGKGTDLIESAATPRVLTEVSA